MDGRTYFSFQFQKDTRIKVNKIGENGLGWVLITEEH